jgi:hypothetical protein
MTKGSTMKRIIALLLLLAAPAFSQTPVRTYNRTSDVFKATINDPSPMRWYNGEPVNLNVSMIKGATSYTNVSGQVAAWVWSANGMTNQYLLATCSVSGASIALSALQAQTALPSGTQGWTWVELWSAPVANPPLFLGVVWRARLETLDRFPPLSYTWTNAPLGERVDALTNEAALRLAGDLAGSNYVDRSIAGYSNWASSAFLTPTGSGALLTGITAAQVGAVPTNRTLTLNGLVWTMDSNGVFTVTGGSGGGAGTLTNIQVNGRMGTTNGGIASVTITNTDVGAVGVLDARYLAALTNAAEFATASQGVAATNAQARVQVVETNSATLAQLTTATQTLWTATTGQLAVVANTATNAYTAGTNAQTRVGIVETNAPTLAQFNAATNSLVSTNDSGRLLDWSNASEVTVPLGVNGHDAAQVDWVRSLLAGNGIYLYGSTNVNPYNSTFYTYIDYPGAPFVRSYTNPAVAAYIGIVMTTQRFTRITGPTTVSTWAGLDSTAGGRSISIHAELYYSYNGVDLLGDWEAPNQTINWTGSNLLQFVISHPDIESTNAAGFFLVRKYKVGAKVSTPNLNLFGGGPAATASHISIEGATFDPSLGTRGATNLTYAGVSVAYDQSTRVLALSGCPSAAVSTTDTRYLAAVTNLQENVVLKSVFTVSNSTSNVRSYFTGGASIWPTVGLTWDDGGGATTATMLYSGAWAFSPAIPFSSLAGVATAAQGIAATNAYMISTNAYMIATNALAIASAGTGGGISGATATNICVGLLQPVIALANQAIVRDAYTALSVEMLAWRLMLVSVLPSMALADGYADAFADQSGVNTLAGSNFTYNATSRRYDWNETRVAMLAHMDSTNAATTPDVVGNTINVVGTCAVTSNPARFGNSLYFPNNVANFCWSPYKSDWNFGTGDFWVEAWIYLTSFTPEQTVVAHVGSVSNTREWALLIEPGGTKIRWYGTENGSGDDAIVDQNYTFSLTTWYHIAVGRASGKIYFFVNGVLQNAGGTTYTKNLYASTAQLIIGRFDYADGYNPMAGYIDELRIIKGTPPYTSSFTTNSAAYSAESTYLNGNRRIEGTNAPSFTFSATNLSAVVWSKGSTTNDISLYYKTNNVGAWTLLPWSYQLPTSYGSLTNIFVTTTVATSPITNVLWRVDATNNFSGSLQGVAIRGMQ